MFRGSSLFQIGGSIKFHRRSAEQALAADAVECELVSEVGLKVKLIRERRSRASAFDASR